MRGLCTLHGSGCQAGSLLNLSGIGGQTGSGLCTQGTHMHTGQAEPGWRQLLTPAALLEPDVEEEVTSVEEQESAEAG